MSAKNNVLDLSKLETKKHRDLVELAYNLPPMQGAIGYFYSFIVFTFKEDDLLRYLPKRIQNKANKHIAEYEEEKAIKEQAEPKKTVSEEDKEVSERFTDLLGNVLDYLNSDNGYSEKVFVLEQLKRTLNNMSRKESEV